MTMARFGLLGEQLAGARSRPLSVAERADRRRRGRTAARPIAVERGVAGADGQASAAEPLQADRQRGADVLLVVDDQDAQTAGDRVESAPLMTGESYLVPATAVAGWGGGGRTAGRGPDSARSTLTRGSPRKPRSRPSMRLSMTRAHALRRPRRGRGRCAAPARAPPRAARCGIEAAGRGGDQLGRDRQRRGRVLLSAGAPRRPRRGRAASSRWSRSSSPTEAVAS